ncbi:hypothetical protein Patl1_30338 [Pistacia atlantica]|uniref:Uncharacterized protein n=1 Tax=Pistacia atlantica TaxID=434234 RepID=A0ACC1AEL7_9ROSI|nr:hypothetical protein Patl1_30338 [Pistacia atlantica]
MSRRGNSPKLELKLNLPPPPRANQEVESPNALVSSLEMSPESSCVSSESEETTDRMHYTSRPVVTTSMVLAGCPRCLMYVMLSDVDRKCPRCKSAVLLDFLNEENTKKMSN